MNRKRFLLAFFAMLPTMFVWAIDNVAPGVVNGITYSINYTKNTAKVIAPINFNGVKKEYEGSIVIPEKIRFTEEDAMIWSEETGQMVPFGEDYIVTEISPEAFKNSITTSVDIPGTIDEIPEYCFSSCTNLQSVTIHYGVKKIGKYAFSGLENLRNVYFNSTVTSLTLGKGGCVIEKGAFSQLPWLTNLSLNFVTRIGDIAFDGCPRLTSVTIPNSVTSIGNGAFSGVSALRA